VGYIAIFLLISHGRLILDYAHCLANIRENKGRRNFQNMMDDQFGEIKSLKNKINFLETILENKDKMIDTKTESEKKTSEKITTLENELNIQKRDLDSCMKIQKENEGTKSSLSSEMIDLRKTYEQMKEEMNVIQEQGQRLKSRNVFLEDENTRLKSVIEANHEEQKTLAESNVDLRELEKKNEALQNEIIFAKKEMQMKIDNMNETIVHLTQELEKKQEALVKIQAERDMYESFHESMSKKTTELKSHEQLS